MQKRILTPVLLCAAAGILCPASTHAGTIVSDNFDGANVALNGVAADVGGTWAAGGNFRADGSGAATGGGPDDDSAYISIGGLDAGLVYTVSGTLSALSGNFFYIGIADSASTNTGERWQASQSNNSINIEWRNISTPDFSLHTQIGGTESRYGTTSLGTSPINPATLSLEIDTTAGLASSTLTLRNGGVAVAGAENIAIDLSSFDNTAVFGFGNEAGGGSWQLDAVSLTSVPEPGSLALLGLGGLLIARRRRDA